MRCSLWAISVCKSTARDINKLGPSYLPVDCEPLVACARWDFQDTETRMRDLDSNRIICGDQLLNSSNSGCPHGFEARGGPETDPDWRRLIYQYNGRDIGIAEQTGEEPE